MVYAFQNGATRKSVEKTSQLAFFYGGLAATDAKFLLDGRDDGHVLYRCWLSAGAIGIVSCCQGGCVK